MRCQDLKILLVGLIFLHTGCAQTDSEIFKNRNLCADKGREYVGKLRTDFGDEGNVYEEMYTYDPSRNTCLVYYNVVTEFVEQYLIMDVSTNDLVFGHFHFRDDGERAAHERDCKNKVSPANKCFSLEELTKKRDELFKK